VEFFGALLENMGMDNRQAGVKFLNLPDYGISIA